MIEWLCVSFVFCSFSMRVDFLVHPQKKLDKEDGIMGQRITCDVV